LRAQLARKVAAGLTVALFPLTACSVDPPSKQALANKLKSETIFQSLSAQQVNCISDVLLKYAKASDLKDYVDGKKTINDVRSPKDKKEKVEKESTACITGSK
jgi:hypothetical protein